MSESKLKCLQQATNVKPQCANQTLGRSKEFNIFMRLQDV